MKAYYFFCSQWMEIIIPLQESFCSSFKSIYFEVSQIPLKTDSTRTAIYDKT